MFHKSLGNIACEKHPIYAEDACLECEDLKESEKEEVSSGTGRMIGKFVGTKSEWKKKIERVERSGGRHALMQFFSLPF